MSKGPVAISPVRGDGGLDQRSSSRSGAVLSGELLKVEQVGFSAGLMWGVREGAVSRMT